MQTKFKFILFVIVLPLLCAFSCNSPTVVGTVDSYVTSKKFQTARSGKRILDYKQAREVVGEWQDTTKNTTVNLSDIEDSVCFTTNDWLLKIKPRLKEGHDYWSDQGSKNIAPSKPVITGKESELHEFDDMEP